MEQNRNFDSIPEPEGHDVVSLHVEEDSFVIASIAHNNNDDISEPARSQNTEKIPKTTTIRRRESYTGDENIVARYLDEIGMHPLLTKDDEVRLAKSIASGIAAQNGLNELSDNVSDEQRKELEEAVGLGEAAKNKFIVSNLRLVVSIAKRFPSDLPLLDLIQEGNLGLMHAVDLFEYQKGFKFSTYATWWIRQFIHRGIRNTERGIRLPTHVHEDITRLRKEETIFQEEHGRFPTTEELAIEMKKTPTRVLELKNNSRSIASLDEPQSEEGEATLMDTVADKSSFTGYEAVEHELWASPSNMDKLLSSLKERERLILTLRFGLNGEDPQTHEEIAATLKLSKQRIKQIEKHILECLRTEKFQEFSELFGI
jgi:RNA polymerase sigma factor (sigma-70 family)